MASQHHPDKGGDTAKFQQIEEAYRVLGDDQKRAEYDQPPPQFNDPFAPFMNQSGFDSIFRSFGFGDIFGRQQQVRNRTLNLQTTISLEEAFHGKELIANLVLPSGKEQVINVKIPAGIQNGTILRLAGMGEDTVPNAPRGDIHLTVNVGPSALFERQNDDLIQEIGLYVWSLVLGERVNIKTIEGKELELNVPAGTQHGDTFSIPGHGMPNMHDNRLKGRLLIKIKSIVPNNLTEDQKNKIRQIIQ